MKRAHKSIYVRFESLIGEFGRIQVEEKRQVTLKDMGWKPK
jgi:hypothetical protein